MVAGFHARSFGFAFTFTPVWLVSRLVTAHGLLPHVCAFLIDSRLPGFMVVRVALLVGFICYAFYGYGCAQLLTRVFTRFTLRLPRGCAGLRLRICLVAFTFGFTRLFTVTHTPVYTRLHARGYVPFIAHAHVCTLPLRSAAFGYVWLLVRVTDCYVGFTFRSALRTHTRILPRSAVAFGLPHTVLRLPLRSLRFTFTRCVYARLPLHTHTPVYRTFAFAPTHPVVVGLPHVVTLIAVTVIASYGSDARTRAFDYRTHAPSCYARLRLRLHAVTRTPC